MSRLFIVTLLLLFTAPSLAAEALLRLQGSNTIGAKLAPELVKGWLKQKGYGRIDERETAPEEEEIVGSNTKGERLRVTIHAHGSTTAFTGLDAGETDVGMASRQVKPEEVVQLARLGQLDRPGAEHVVGLDGIAVVVNPANGINTLDVETLRAIFAGRVTDWSQVGGKAQPIHVYARDDNSGTYDTFKHLVLGKEAPLTAGAKRFDSNADLSDSVAADPDGIGFVGLPYVRRSKALAISDQGTRAILPTAFTVATEDYVLARRLYLYLPTALNNPLAAEFVAYAQAAAGQQAVEQIGFVSQRIIAGPAAVAGDAPEEYRELTRYAKRLSLNFRFREGSAVLDTKAQRDLERLLSYVAQNDNGRLHVLLLGFADHTETLPYHSLGLSIERADLIADLLLQAGVAPQRVRGFGAALPVASDGTLQGRAKNRRVEVWVSSAEGIGALAAAQP